MKNWQEEFNQEFYESHSWIEVNDHISALLEQERQLRKKEKCKTAEVNFKAGKFAAMKEVMECLPKEENNARVSEYYSAWNCYRQQLLDNLKAKGLIK